jgi:hypothetical protein
VRSDLNQFDHRSIRVRHANEAGLGVLRLAHLRLREKLHAASLELGASRSVSKGENRYAR